MASARRPSVPLVTGFLAFATILAGCASDPAAEAQPDEAMADAEDLLYVQTARAALLVATSGDGLEVVLLDVDPHLVFFSDRPVRDAGTIPTSSLLEEIFLGQAPPNAALVGKPVGADHELVLALELDTPVLDALAGRMSYQARVLPGLSGGLDHLGGASSLDTLPPMLSDVALFIDSKNYHRCFGNIDNETAYGMTLMVADMVPSASSSKWGTVSQSIPAGGHGDFTFRFLSTGTSSGSQDKSGKLVYQTDTPQGFTVEIDFTCHTAISDHGVFVSEACNYDEYAAPFDCAIKESSKGKTARFTIS